MPRRPNWNRRRGFTLIELVAVMILMGLCAGIVMISVSSHMDSATLQRDSDRIATLDQRLRRFARSTRTPIEVVFDKSKNRLDIEYSDQIDRSADRPRAIDLDPKLSFADVRTNSSNRRHRLYISPYGQSPSYGLQLQSARGASRWLVVLGQSGQVISCTSQQQFDALLPP